MEFICRLGTPEGAIVEQVHESSAEAALRLELEGKGYHVFSVRQKGLAFGLSLPRFASSRVPDRAFLVFNQEFAALLKAGLPLLQSLDIMLERGSEGRLRTVLREIRERVKNGEELSAAFDHFGHTFPPLYAASLKAGERSGELESIIRRFIRYQKLMMESRRRVVSAVVYPIVLLILSVVMVGIMSLYVIPQFEDFFDSMDVELPLLTRAILAASLFFRRHYVALSAVVVVSGYLITHWSRTRQGRLFFHHQLLRIPLVGTVFHRFSLSQFSRSLGTLLSGGIPLVPALDVAVGAVGNDWVRSQMSQLASVVSEGRPFYESLQSSGVFTPVSIDMVRVGEATGALDQMLADVSEFFEQEAETRLDRILVLLEPLTLLGMGIVIATLMIAMYLPMFSAWGQVD